MSMNRHILWVLSLLIGMGLLSACENVITKQEFATYENSAFKNKKGRWEASIPNCRNIIEQEGEDMFVYYDYFGCNTSKNLAMMIANPKDFVLPKATRTYPGKPLADAVNDYVDRGGKSGSGK